VRQTLLELGVPGDRPVALIENASLTGERIIAGMLDELASLASKLGEGPAIMVIGEAAAQAHSTLEAARAA
jgi:uroporphyrin-III C-methyltransferase